MIILSMEMYWSALLLISPLVFGFNRTLEDSRGSDDEVPPKILILPMWDHEKPSSVLEIRIGYITGSSRRPGNLEYSRPGLTISGGLTLALDYLRKSNYFNFHDFGIQFRLTVTETHGDEGESLKRVAQLWRDERVALILGPQETCLHEAKLGSSLNIPMISYFCSDEETSDKSHFPTFSRTRPPDAAISRAIVSLVLRYGWKKSIVLIYADSREDPRFRRGAKSLAELFHRQGVILRELIPYKGPYHHGYGDNPFEAIVDKTKDKTRIYILLSEYYEHIGLVLALQNQNLLGKGDYLVIGVAMDDDYKEEEEWNPRRYFRGLLHDETVDEAPTAFQSYLGIVASPPRNYTEFSRLVNHHMELAPFGWPNPLARLGGIKRIRIEAAYLHDAVMLYAKALRDLIQVNPNVSMDKLLHKINNGLDIAKRLRNVSYQSATGLLSQMDENGDAVGNFTLVALKNYNGEQGIYPIGYFVANGKGILPELALREAIEWVGGGPPPGEPPCGFQGEYCKSDRLSMVSVGVIASILVFVSFATWLMVRHWRLSRDMDRLLWRIDSHEIQNLTSGGTSGRSGSQSSLARFSSVYAPLVGYRGRIFAGKRLTLDILDGTLKEQLKMLREIRHENLNAFIGAAETEDGLLLLTEYSSRGSIKDILENGDLKLDDMFVGSLVGDLLRGLSYLTDSSGFRFHGNLKPSNCLVDSRWVLKLTDFGLIRTYHRRGSIGGGTTPPIYRGLAHHPNHHHHLARLSTTGNADDNGSGGLSPLLPPNFNSPYLPPEYPALSNGEIKNPIEGYRRGDIYSVGVICWELVNRCSLAEFLGLKESIDIRRASQLPGFWSQAFSNLLQPEFGTNSNPRIVLSVPSSPVMTQRTILNGKLPGSRSQSGFGQFTPNFHGSANMIIVDGAGIIPPPTPTNTEVSVLECLENCVSLDPEQRPDIKSLQSKLKPLHKGMRSNIFDTMIALMEKYANNLERLVDERTRALSEEKRKTESLLYELIPSSVAEELKEGLRVPAESYESVSVYFSDIVGFTTIAAQSSPIQVVEFLNDLYTCFDAIIENFDVYKVETIGDAYMVASGLPVAQEGPIHARELAKMALALLHGVQNFQIRHRSSDTLNLRIGLHSGPVCAGVVGQKRPRYCLFGDTVNVASRMESTGLPLRIHCSETFTHLVESDFELEKRGHVDVKGKGDMVTYWLRNRK